MKKLLAIVAILGFVAVPAMADIVTNIDGAAFGETPDQSGYQPLSYAEIVELGLNTRSNPLGSAYSGGSLVQTSSSAFLLDSGPNAHVWSNGSKSIGNNGLSGAAMTMAETYIPGAGPNGGDIIQVNIFTNDRTAWVPSGAAGPSGAPFVSWRMDVGHLAHPDQIDFSPAPQTVLSQGAAWFRGDNSLLGTFALTATNNSPSAVGGVAVVGLGGANIAGFDLAEGAIFWELTPEPGSLALLGVGVGSMLLRRRR